MRTLLCTALCLFLLVAVAPIGAEETAPWFDLEKCAFCKHIGAEEGLIDNMKAEYHDLKNGLLSVITVDPKYKEAFTRAHEAMNNVGVEMQKTGEIPYMCQHCQQYGEFMMSGVVMECIEAEIGSICLMTSDKPEMVEKLQAFGKRNAEEMKKFAESKTKQ